MARRGCERTFVVLSQPLKSLTNLRFANESARPLANLTICGQRSGRECIFTFRTDPQFSMVVPLRSQARLWLSLLHWAYYGLFPPLAAASVRPCASLARCSGAADALWACPRAVSPSGLHLFASVCSAKNARNDVHAVISDLSLVLPILCQCSEMGRIKKKRPICFILRAYFSNLAATSFKWRMMGRCWGQTCSHCPHSRQSLALPKFIVRRV